MGIMFLNRDMSFSVRLGNFLTEEKGKFIEFDDLEKEAEDVMSYLL
jgi:hypothetical protein